jgi:hypothetical protein
MMELLPTAPIVEPHKEYGFLLTSLRDITLPRLNQLLSGAPLDRSSSNGRGPPRGALNRALVEEFANCLTHDLWMSMRHIGVRFEDVKVHLDPSVVTRRGIARELVAIEGPSSSSRQTQSLWRRTLQEREEASEFTFLALIHCGSSHRNRDVVVSTLIALAHSPRALHSTNVFVSRCQHQLRLQSAVDLRLDPLLVGACEDLRTSTIACLPVYCSGDKVRSDDVQVAADDARSAVRTASPRDRIPELRSGSVRSERQENRPRGSRLFVVTQWDLDEFAGRHSAAPVLTPPISSRSSSTGVPLPVAVTVTPIEPTGMIPVAFHYTDLRAATTARRYAAPPSEVQSSLVQHPSIRRRIESTPSWD